MNLDVVQIDQVGAVLLGDDQTVALSGLLNVRATNRVIKFDALPNARIDFLAELDVGAETAGGNHNAVLGIENNLLAEVLGCDACDAALILQQVGCLGIGQHLDGAVRTLDDLFKAANVGVAGRSGRIMAALPKGACSRADFILKLHAHALEPFDRLHGVLSQILYEFRIALVVAALHRLVVELLEAVFNALFALAFRVNSIQCTFGNVRGTAEIAQLFNNNDFLGAGLISGNGCCKTGTAAADYNDVSIVGLGAGRMLFNLFGQLIDIATGLFKALFNAAQQSQTGNGSTRNGVNAERLILQNLVGHQLESHPPYADCFKVLGRVDLFDAVLTYCHFDSNRSVMAVNGSRIGAGLERRRSCLSRIGCLQSRCRTGSK